MVQFQNEAKNSYIEKIRKNKNDDE